jgi:hypothetical protein
MDNAKRKRLANLRPFKPGQSGNPGGRTKAQIDVRTAAREYTQEAIDTLVLIMRNGKPSEAAMAANSLLDRGWGKPKQSVEVTEADQGPLQIEDVRARNIALVQAVAARIAGISAAGGQGADPRRLANGSATDTLPRSAVTAAAVAPPGAAEGDLQKLTPHPEPPLPTTRCTPAAKDRFRNRQQPLSFWPGNGASW